MNCVLRLACAAAFVATAFSVPVNAQGQGRGMGMVMTNCEAEIKKHCADVPHGAAEVPKCLEKHMSELSDACKSALQNRGPKGPGRGRMRNQ